MKGGVTAVMVVVGFSEACEAEIFLYSRGLNSR